MLIACIISQPNPLRTCAGNIQGVLYKEGKYTHDDTSQTHRVNPPDLRACAQSQIIPAHTSPCWRSGPANAPLALECCDVRRIQEFTTVLCLLPLRQSPTREQHQCDVTVFTVAGPCYHWSYCSTCGLFWLCLSGVWLRPSAEGSSLCFFSGTIE